jgi:hypothetical protein
MKKTLIYLTFLILLIPYINAQPSQVTNTITLNPYYLNSLTANTNYDFTFTINPTDGYTRTQSATISFRNYMSPTITYTLTINGQSCNPAQHTISTTYSNSEQAEISFDCSSIINHVGNYTARLRTNKNTGSITSWLDFTYINKPKATITVHGTEYEANQPAKVWLQLINNTGGNVNNGLCYLDIYTPDNEEYLEYAQMTNLNHDGIYYYDLETPEIEGVYPAIARCYYEATSKNYYPTTYQMYNGTAVDTLQTKILLQDGTFWRFNEDNTGGIRRLDFATNVTDANNCTNISESLLTGITIFDYAKFDSVVNDDITIHIFNHSNNQWIQLPNKILEGNVWRTVSNSINTNNITKSGLYNQTRGGFLIRYNDTTLTDGADDNLDIDHAYVSCDQLANPEWTEVKGSSEMHINPPTTGLGNPYFVYTLCGDSNTESISNGCMQFKFDNYTSPTFPEGFLEPQGYLYENITVINSRQTDINTHFYYETPAGVDCTAILDILEERNGTNNLYDTTTMRTGSEGDNCELTLPVTFNASENQIQIVIIADNYMLWENNRANRLVNFYRQPIQDLCGNFATVSNVTMTVPITTTLSEYENNTVLMACWQSLDDLYWFDDYYNNGLLDNTSGTFSSNLAGTRFYYPQIIDHFNTVEALLTNNIPLFAVETLCEKINGIDLPTDDFSCQILKEPDDYFSSQEGWILANLTFTNTYHSNIFSTFQFETGQDVDCSAILEILRVESNGTITNIENDVVTRSGTLSNCKITLPVSFTTTTDTFDIIITQENYIHWNMLQMKDKIYAVRNNTADFCNDLLTNVSWYVPINSSIDNLNYTFEQKFCLRALDDLYWFDYFDQEHLALHNDTHYLWQVVTYLDEYKYFYPFIMENNDIINQYKRNINQEQTINLTQTILDQLFNVSTTNDQILAEILEGQNNNAQYYLNLTQLINAQTLNISQIIAQNNNLTNITQTNQNWLIEIWNYLTGYITNQTIIINQKLDTILNQTISSQNINIYATTDYCITGSQWEITANVKDNYNIPLTNLQANCTIQTTIWGTDNMTYTPTGTWTYTQTCPTAQNWTWTIECK